MYWGCWREGLSLLESQREEKEDRSWVWQTCFDQSVFFIFIFPFCFCFFVFFCVLRGEREFKRLNTRKSERMEKEQRTWTSSRGCLSRLIVPLEVQVSVIYYSRPFCIRSDNEDRRAKTSILISFHTRKEKKRIPACLCRYTRKKSSRDNHNILWHTHLKAKRKSDRLRKMRREPADVKL
jgi:hypothetical protein